MYNYGIINFLNQKKVKKHHATIKAFLEYRNETFSHKNWLKVNEYIQNHWSQFASFIDISIKNGFIEGKAVKLNYYFDEVRERNEKVNAEFASVNLSPLEKRVLKFIHVNMGTFNNFISKRGINMVPKKYSYTTKRLQCLPWLNLLKENNLLEEFNLFMNEKTAQNGGTITETQR